VWCVLFNWGSRDRDCTGIFTDQAVPSHGSGNACTKMRRGRGAHSDRAKAKPMQGILSDQEHLFPGVLYWLGMPGQARVRENLGVVIGFVCFFIS
jgi:hypothetical protein